MTHSSQGSLAGGFKNALVSVSNKAGLVDFIGPLSQKGLRVVATQGTARFLKSEGVPVVELSEHTGFKEVMDGRVKSLHPRIYIPLLARLSHAEDQKALQKAGLSPFDLLVCNLYPFSEKRAEGVTDLEALIDVGGPSMLRAGAKNFESVTVVCDPTDYPWILKGGLPSLQKRKALAGKAFAFLAEYNSHIAHWLLKSPVVQEEGSEAGLLSQAKKIQLRACPFKHLLYGENPHQKAIWFQVEKTGLHSAEKLQGKELSFNNISDLDSAVSLLRELKGPSAVVVKHNNPCGVACADQMEVALDKALKADPVSVFGGLVALNRVVSEESAQRLCALFLEAVIAPDYHESALRLFQSKKKNLRILKWPPLLEAGPPFLGFSCRSVAGGLLMQEQKTAQDSKSWRFLKAEPSQEVQLDLQLAWKVATHLKSNAIALVSNQQTVGLGMGQVNRVSAVQQAIQSWQKMQAQEKEPVMASDGFFPFPDSIELAGQAGIKWIVQPGGSLRDKEVIAKALEHSINMILTGQRGFAH